MSDLLGNLDLVQDAVIRSPFGLITDVDGTISKTVPLPQEAQVSPLCRRYLSILCNHLALVAVISGRPASQVRDMIKDDRVVYVGNHGLERLVDGRPFLAEGVRGYPDIIKSVTSQLVQSLPIEGLKVEDKGITATIHYRLAAHPEAAKKRILAALKNSAQAGNLRIMPGKMSINLLPPVEMDKGTAVLELIREYHLQSGVYLGDEITDIDAFRAIHAASRDSDFHGVAVGIISPEMPDELLAEADFTLDGVDAVERFLGWLSQTVSQSG